jgi:5'-nucleotidase
MHRTIPHGGETPKSGTETRVADVAEQLILVTNDDGIHSEGVHALGRAMSAICETWIIAPDRERSAVGHSFTMNHPIRAKLIQPRVVITDGTPTDCVMFGVLGYLEKKPCLVASGINFGPNLGDDVTYSGTVSAALEGTMLGVPSLAVSLNYPKRGNASGPAECHFETAGRVARIIAGQLLEMKLPRNTFFNVNVPNIPFEELQGFAMTRLGRRIYKDRVIRRIDPHGKDYYWIGGEEPSWHDDEGTDFHAMLENKVSITPINFNLTDFDTIESMQSWSQDLGRTIQGG